MLPNVRLWLSGTLSYPPLAFMPWQQTKDFKNRFT
jgi:hypothetical protein